MTTRLVLTLAAFVGLDYKHHTDDRESFVGCMDFESGMPQLFVLFWGMQGRIQEYGHRALIPVDIGVQLNRGVVTVVMWVPVRYPQSPHRDIPLSFRNNNYCTV